MLGSYSPRGQGARWVPGFLSVPGGPAGQEHPHKVRAAPKHLPPRCCHRPLVPERLCPSEKPPAQAEHSPPRPCRLCCPSGREAPSRPAAKRRRVRACGRREMARRECWQPGKAAMAGEPRPRKSQHRGNLPPPGKQCQGSLPGPTARCRPGNPRSWEARGEICPIPKVPQPWDVPSARGLVPNARPRVRSLCCR